MDLVGAELDDLLAEFESNTLVSQKKKTGIQASPGKQQNAQPTPRRLGVKTKSKDQPSQTSQAAVEPETKQEEELEELENDEEERDIEDEIDAILGEFPGTERLKHPSQPRMEDVPQTGKPVPNNPSNTNQSQNLEAQPRHIQPQTVQPRNLQPQNLQPVNIQYQQNSQSQNLQQQSRNIQPQNLQPQNLQPQNSQPQNSQPRNLQPQNLQPQNLQSQNSQPRNIQPQNIQPQNLQPQNLQPRNIQPQNLQPQNQPQNLQPRNLQPQNLQPQNLQPRNLQPQNLQPRNLQPQRAQPVVVCAGPDDFQTGEQNWDVSEEMSPDAKMEALQFIRLPNTPLPYDMDNNTASDFKIAGTTNTEVGEPHFITLRPLKNGNPVALKNPQKYISVELTHSGNVVLVPWWRDNSDNTYSFGFCTTKSGTVNMKIKLCGNLLFNLNHNVSPGGEEKYWMARYREPFVGTPWLIDIIRRDGARPPGMYPFQVEIQGSLDDFKLVDLGGVYQVSTVPSAAGVCRVDIKLFGKDIVGSPITTEINDEYNNTPNYFPPPQVVQPQRNRGLQTQVLGGAPVSPSVIGMPYVGVNSTGPNQARTVILPPTVPPITPRSADDALADLLDELEQY